MGQPPRTFYEGCHVGQNHTGWFTEPWMLLPSAAPRSHPGSWGLSILCSLYRGGN